MIYTSGACAAESLPAEGELKRKTSGLFMRVGGKANCYLCLRWDLRMAPSP